MFQRGAMFQRAVSRRRGERAYVLIEDTERVVPWSPVNPPDWPEVHYSVKHERVGRVACVLCACGKGFDATETQQQVIRCCLINDVVLFGSEPVECPACRHKSQRDPRVELNVYLQKHEPEHVADVKYHDWIAGLGCPW